MFEIYLETKQFILDFAKNEVSKLTSKTPQAQGSFIIVRFKDENEFFKASFEIIYYSRCIERIYLKIDENLKNLDLIKKEFTFEICSKTKDKEIEKTLGAQFLSKNPNLGVNLKNPDLSFKVFEIGKKEVILLDLTNFELTKREYKLNVNSTTINTLIPIYAFYKLELQKKKEIRIIDPISNLGDIIIEASIFHPLNPLHVTKRHQIPISKIFSHIPNLPKEKELKGKFVSIVQNNKIFKQQRENINFAKSKIKLSQYELDWLDVKFKNSDFDYTITQIPPGADKKMLEDFFYQAEFISKKAICTISKNQSQNQSPRNSNSQKNLQTKSL
jgi:23S rRNA G2445 N2-methylase RlmL